MTRLRSGSRSSFAALAKARRGWADGALPRPSGAKPRFHNRGEASVQRRMARRACFPAAVHPEPLVGITADKVFNDFGEFCGVGYYVGLVVMGANQLDGGIKAQN